jgi:hypothetical protein
MKELSKNGTKLSEFPRKLRQLGRFMIDSGQLMTLKEACGSIGINYNSAKSQILKCKKRGLDFHRLVDDHVIEKLRNARPEVYKSLRERAISGSLGHQKLFAEIVGDSKNKVEVNHKVTGLFAVFGGGSGTPQWIKEEDKINKPNGVQIINAEIED